MNNMISKKNIFIKNIYYMLSYAFNFNGLHHLNLKNMEIEAFDNIDNIFSAILAKGISYVIKHGLHRDYIPFDEDLNILRGKIDIPLTVGNIMKQKNLLHCHYDELSENILFNRILKTTTQLFINNNKIEKEYRDILKKQMLFLNNIETIDPILIPWSTIRYHRNTRIYRILIGICRLALEGMLMTENNGKRYLADFIDGQRIEHLYECFLVEYYKQKYPKIKVHSPIISWSMDENKIDEIFYEGNKFLPQMRTDLVLEYENKILIIDAKCYGKILIGRSFENNNYTSIKKEEEENDKKLRSSHLYQIFSYVKNMVYNKGNDKIISGLLLYAMTDEKIQPHFSYHMSGNKISARSLDLSQDFAKIEEQLKNIVEEHFFGIR